MLGNICVIHVCNGLYLDLHQNKNFQATFTRILTQTYTQNMYILKTGFNGRMMLFL